MATTIRGGVTGEPRQHTTILLAEHTRSSGDLGVTLSAERVGILD